MKKKKSNVCTLIIANITSIRIKNYFSRIYINNVYDNTFCFPVTKRFLIEN